MPQNMTPVGNPGQRHREDDEVQDSADFEDESMSDEDDEEESGEEGSDSDDDDDQSVQSS